MSTHLPGFQSFSGFLHNVILAKVASSSIRVNIYGYPSYKGLNVLTTTAFLYSADI